MATVVNVPADTRSETYGKGLADMFSAYMVARKDARFNQAADQAVKSIYGTNTREDAMAIYDSMPYDIREKKGPGILQAINDKYPGFEQISAYKPTGEETSISITRGQNPEAEVAKRGLTMTHGPADVWGIDTPDPGIGIITASSEAEAHAKNDALQKAGLKTLGVLSPSEVTIRQKSLQTAATVERADIAAAKARATRGPTTYEQTKADRLAQEKANDPYATDAGVGVLMAKEDVLGREININYGQQTTADKGTFFPSPGNQLLAGEATELTRKAIRRGLDPSTAQAAAIRAVNLSLLPSLIEQNGQNDTGLASTRTNFADQINRQFGVKVDELNTRKAVVENAASIPEYSGNTPDSIRSISLSNGKDLLYAKIDGRFVPLRLARPGEVRKATPVNKGK